TQTPHTDISTLSLHDALPICARLLARRARPARLQCQDPDRNGRGSGLDRPARALPTAQAEIVASEPAERVGRSARGVRSSDDLRSEEHTSELQSRFDLVCRLL